jgi:hypothetical protein
MTKNEAALLEATIQGHSTRELRNAVRQERLSPDAVEEFKVVYWKYLASLNEMNVLYGQLFGRSDDAWEVSRPIVEPLHAQAKERGWKCGML